MKKKNTFVKLLTSQMSDLSIAPSQAIMKKQRKKREMPSKNPTAIEPKEYAQQKKVCTYCQSINNCKYKYINNCMSNQPRYKCLNKFCKKLFALVLHNRPIGRTYSKKRGEDPIELQGLTKTCPKCGGIDNASFTYYNNDKQKQGLQPRFKCLNGNCKKHFQMRKVIGDDGRTKLVHTSRVGPQTSNEQQPQEYSEFSNTLPDYDYRMYNAVNIAPDASTLTENDLYHEMNMQVSEVGIDDELNNQQESLVETTQDYHTNNNPTSMSTLWGFHPNGGDFRNGDIFRNGDSEHQIVQKTRGETIQDYNTEDNPSMPLNDMVPNGDNVYQNGDFEPEINQESHVETIQDYNQKEDNLSVPWNDTIVNGGNFQSELKSAKPDVELYWAMLNLENTWDVSTILGDGD